MKNPDEFCANYFQEITDMVRLLHHAFDFRSNHGWKWVSGKGIHLILDIEYVRHNTNLLFFATERLGIKSCFRKAQNSLYKQTGVFFLMPPVKPHLMEKVEAIRNSITIRKKYCEVCGTELNNMKLKYCDKCRMERQKERQRERQKERRKATPKPKICPVCGKEFTPAYQHTKLCSDECKKLHRNARSRNRYISKKHKQSHSDGD